jgi:hypothetical protein
MRKSNDRYGQHRRASDLAWSLLRHGARTHTIALWTGLSEHRVRTLFRRYGDEIPNAKRPRGKSPYRIDLLLQSPRTRLEASTWAGMCVAAEFIPPLHVTPGARLIASIARGELLCETFESFKLNFPDSQLTIEQAILVVVTIARREEIDLVRCKTCGGVVIIDRLAIDATPCPHCSSELPPESFRTQSLFTTVVS